jgi:hypothetical protein
LTRKAAGLRVDHQATGDGDQPALSVVMIACRTHPFQIERSLIADVGVHAISRRSQRAWEIDDRSVLIDLAPLGAAWAATVKAGPEFKIEAPLGQRLWVGAVSKVADRALPVLVVRSFIGE